MSFVFIRFLMRDLQHRDAVAMLRTIFEPAKKEKVRGRCRKLYNDVIHNFYFSPNKVRVNKYKTSLETHKKRDYLANLHVEYRV
jgi:hypothetical protein